MIEKRRYPRVQINPSLGEVLAILGAQVIWPNHETSDVLDLSYKGAAVRRPGLFPVALEARTTLQVQLGWLEPFATQARLAWANLDWVGVEFGDLPPEGHAAMAEYLDARLTGDKLKPIERALYAGAQDFTAWFQGPSGTHVFVWMDSSRSIERVHVDFGGVPVYFERGGRRAWLDREQRKALLILSQMDKPGLPMEDFVRTLG